MAEKEQWENRFSRQQFKSVPNANASFKTAPFIIHGSSTTFGRRLITHEYPLQNIPFTEDLGRKVRIFVVDGALLGATYLENRDTMAALCEKDGIGELIHPYYGSLSVYCEEIKFEDSSDELRVTRFKATFIETGEHEFPDEVIDTQGAILNQTQVTLESLKTPFEKVYDVVSLPLVFTSGALEVMTKGWDAIEKAKILVGVGSEFQRDLQALRIGAEAIVTSGAAVFETMIQLITFGLLPNENENDDIDPVESFLSLNSLTDFDASTDEQSQKSDAINDLIQEASTITTALNSSNINFESATEAREFRNIILQNIDKILFRGTSDEVTEEYQNLRALVSEDIAQRALTLPDLKIIQPKKTQPSIVLSQLLYGNKENAKDINKRNNVEHPGFIPGSEDLEVLISV